MNADIYASFIPSQRKAKVFKIRIATTLAARLLSLFTVNFNISNTEHTSFCKLLVEFIQIYVKNGKYCVVNNTYEPQSTVVYTGDGNNFLLKLDANEIKWYHI